MSSVYLAGFGLASSMGANLTEAVSRLHQPPAPQRRTIRGLDFAIPYFAIDQAAQSWRARCEMLVCQVVEEAGNTDRNGALYIASSSLNAGAMETNEPHAASLTGFLIDIARMLDWRGPVHLINTACTSSLNAILAAQDVLLAGIVDDAVIIGLELENQLTIAGFAGMQLLSGQECRPFAADRNGLVLGEAVAALRLSRRPARWRVAGGAQVIDSDQPSGASQLAYEAMLKQTLGRSQLDVAQIDLTKVQAAGSIPNDAIEAHALSTFFPRVPSLLSLKPLIGHTLGASGAAEIALMLAMLEKRQWPDLAYKTASEADSALGVHLAASPPERIKNILACILGFGGSHSCVAIEDTDS